MGLHLENEVARRIVKTPTIIFNNRVYIHLFPGNPVAKSRVYLIINSIISSPPPLKYVIKSGVHCTVDGTVCGTVSHGAVCLMVRFVLKYSLLLVLTEVQG